MEDYVELRNPSKRSKKLKNGILGQSFRKIHRQMSVCITKIREAAQRKESDNKNIITLDSKVQVEDNQYTQLPTYRKAVDSSQNPPPLPQRNEIQIEDSESTSGISTASSSEVDASGSDISSFSEILNLSNYPWYWGPITKAHAENLLSNEDDGTFLVRDSTSTNYLFTISFRSDNNTVHLRITYCRGKYSFYNQDQYNSVVDLIEAIILASEENHYFLSKPLDIDKQRYSIKLTKPLQKEQLLKICSNTSKENSINYTDDDDDVSPLSELYIESRSLNEHCSSKVGSEKKLKCSLLRSNTICESSLAKNRIDNSPTELQLNSDSSPQVEIVKTMRRKSFSYFRYNCKDVPYEQNIYENTEEILNTKNGLSDSYLFPSLQKLSKKYTFKNLIYENTKEIFSLNSSYVKQDVK